MSVGEHPYFTQKPADGFLAPKRQPLTREEIEALVIRGGLYDCITDPYDKHNTGDPWGSVMDDIEKVVRKIEAAHGISAPSPVQQGEVK
jgi:hypothetical protein